MGLNGCALVFCGGALISAVYLHNSQRQYVNCTILMILLIAHSLGVFLRGGASIFAQFPPPHNSFLPRAVFCSFLYFFLIRGENSRVCYCQQSSSFTSRYQREYGVLDAYREREAGKFQFVCGVSVLLRAGNGVHAVDGHESHFP